MAAPRLETGSEVSLEAVRKADWLQGHAPETFEPGMVYVFECWATWCGPCIASIPHLNELHRKYNDKGLRVHGMNVWEDDKQVVKGFVKNKGKDMSYPVAFTGGRGSAFDKAWLEPAGVSGIPTAFVVVDGKLVDRVHPSQLTDDRIESLLKSAAESAPKPPPAKRGPADVLRDYPAAAEAADVAKMEALIKELVDLDPKQKDLPDMQVDLLVAKQDWSSAAEAIEVMSDNPRGQVFLKKLTSRVLMNAGRTYPPEWLKMLASAHASSRKDHGLTAMDHVGISMLYWRAEDKEKARSYAAQAATVAKEESARESNPAVAGYFSKFSASVQSGVMPSMKDFLAAMPHRAEESE